jgi:hypothetical protein
MCRSKTDVGRSGQCGSDLLPHAWGPAEAQDPRVPPLGSRMALHKLFVSTGLGFLICKVAGTRTSLSVGEGDSVSGEECVKSVCWVPAGFGLVGLWLWSVDEEAASIKWKWDWTASFIGKW